MFNKILIANRGEIACRIMETAKRMGVATVAVYSDADRKARHVRLADEAIHIGGAAAADSYLRGDVILKAAQDSGAEAIHPGYGFLSENANFANACESAGIKFIGPSADSINAMGLKDKAKDIMEKAGVPVVPGYRGANKDADFLSKEAVEIGFPVLIKAVAGGGGKGMRLVENEGEFAELLEACRREAKASFSNDHVLIEKFIQKPRHVEMQVFGDSHGNGVHLFERDCSLQRRHQKVVEEAPAPGLPDKVRAIMGAAAVTAVESLGYENAGTIEFIMDSKTYDFYFMEMNTRLQVEHPVTEMITGLDLVEWQLRIAAGEKLPLTQDEIKCDGHAFEVRLYAEDPANEFLPQTGKVTRFISGDVARIDTGVDEGDEVTIHYDPMIAKIIVHGENRNEALLKMQDAFAKTGIAGFRTNQEFLRNIFAQPDFISGEVDTGFIAVHFDDLISKNYGAPAQEDLALAAVYFLMGFNSKAVMPALCGHPDFSCMPDPRLHGGDKKSFDPWACRDNWRMGGVVNTSLSLVNRGEVVEVPVLCQGQDFEITAGEKTFVATYKSFENDVMTVVVDKHEVSALMIGSGRDLNIFRDGRMVDMHLYVHGSSDDDEAGEGRILTPMPGKIIDVLVKQGDAVEKNQPLLIIEAMKMEMTIRAGCAGVVDELPVSANDQVPDGALLVSIKGDIVV